MTHPELVANAEGLEVFPLGTDTGLWGSLEIVHNARLGGYFVTAKTEAQTLYREREILGPFSTREEAGDQAIWLLQCELAATTAYGPAGPK